MEINYFAYLNFKRTLNILGVFISYFLSKIIRVPIVFGSPISLSIEPTNICNLRCPECPSGAGKLTRAKGMLTMEDFKKIIDQFYKRGLYLQLFFQGEPYLNKNLHEMIKYAQKRKIYVSISSNGLLFNENNFDNVLENAPDKLIFSVDGLDQPTYEFYRRGGEFSVVDKAIRQIARIKKEKKLKKPFIEFQFIAMKNNERQIIETFKYAKEAGADKRVIKSMQVYSYESAIENLPSNKKYHRYNLNNGKIEIKGGVKNGCFSVWRTSVITWDGKVVPCCYDKDADNILGDIKSNLLAEIWKGGKYRKFRKIILKRKKSINICQNCAQGINENISERNI